MENITTLDIICWLILGLSLLLLIISARSIRQARAMQNKAMSKVDYSIELQKKTNHTLSLILNETRRQNQYLSDLAGMEPIEEPEHRVNQNAKDDFSSPDDDHLEHESEPSSQTKLYVGNIDYAATETELAGHFAPFGQVEFVNIPVNRYTGKARGFGFVTFATQEEAEHAMALNGSEFKGRQIQVNFAKERERETA